MNQAPTICATRAYSMLRRRNPSAAIKVAEKVPFAAWPQDAALYEASVGKAMYATSPVGTKAVELSPADRRKIIMRTLRKEGTRFGELSDKINAALGTISNDLKKLIKEGKIVGPIKARYYIAGQEPRDTKASKPIDDHLKKVRSIRDDKDNLFLGAMTTKAMSLGDLAHVFEISESASRKRVMRLLKAGKVVMAGERPSMSGGVPAKLYIAKRGGK